MISMNCEPIRKQIDEERAAILLGLSKSQLRKLCENFGLGQATAGEPCSQKMFNYKDLYRLCCRVARPEFS
jgi:hypothetical protein